MVCLDFRRVAPVTVISGPLSPSSPRRSPRGGGFCSQLQYRGTNSNNNNIDTGGALGVAKTYFRTCRR